MELLLANTYHRGAACFADRLAHGPPPPGLRCAYDSPSGCAYVTLGDGPHVGDRAGAEAQAARLRPHVVDDDCVILHSQPHYGRIFALRSGCGWSPRDQWSSIDERPEGGQVLLDAAALLDVVLRGDDSARPSRSEGFQLREIGGGGVVTFCARGKVGDGRVVVERMSEGVPEPLRAALAEYRALDAAPLTMASIERMLWLRATVCASGDPDAIAGIFACVRFTPGDL